MKGEEKQLVDFMDGHDKRFVIPVYQRSYAWKTDNCKQLFDDLQKTIQFKRKSHFFGSIVAIFNPDGDNHEFQIIDGQQRLTTTTLLLLAIYKLVKKGILTAEDDDLSAIIWEDYLVDKFKRDNFNESIKLRPIQKDFEALKRLFENDENLIEDSNITSNYKYFYNRIQKEELTVDELFKAVNRLEIISITLKMGIDDPQLIFESLNSTGLRLTEGDKIRNFILMDLSQSKQASFFDKYWNKIESLTHNAVDQFIRDYLSVTTGHTPNLMQTYVEFKKYVEDNNLDKNKEDLLKELLKYARYYENLLGYNVKIPKLGACINRLNRLETTVTRPFFLEVLNLQSEQKITNEECLHIFETTESFVFRRQICDFPTSGLNKFFLSLHREIIKLDDSSEKYFEKLKFVYASKTGRTRFPDDVEFAEAFSTKSVYEKMKGKNKTYLFERLENYGTLEDKNVYDHLDRGDYSIEHIMPQTLSAEWRQSLGKNYEQIHETWLHRVANLTLTAYNSKYSNLSFHIKRDTENGFKKSGLRMNQRIAQQQEWGEKELIQRDQELRELALKIWSFPQSSFSAPHKEYDSIALDDDVDMTGEKLVKFTLKDVEYPAKNWWDMFEKVLLILYNEDKAFVLRLINSNEDHFGTYVNASDQKMRKPLEIAVGLFAETNTSTSKKLNILRQLLAASEKYALNDLVFYLREKNDQAEDEAPLLQS